MRLTREERAERKKKLAEQMAQMEANREKVRAIVATGKCPMCGRMLRRNLAISGWWQCSQFGADVFRADSHLPSCEWQGFTE